MSTTAWFCSSLSNAWPYFPAADNAAASSLRSRFASIMFPGFLSPVSPLPFKRRPMAKEFHITKGHLPGVSSRASASPFLHLRPWSRQYFCSFAVLSSCISTQEFPVVLCHTVPSTDLHQQHRVHAIQSYSYVPPLTVIRGRVAQEITETVPTPHMPNQSWLGMLGLWLA